MKIQYSTHYDTTNRVCGSVNAAKFRDGYSINQRQYNNALKHRTVGGDAGIKFHTVSHVYLVDQNGEMIRPL